jgi:exodeoxyribonuclease VII small subunit
MMPPKSKTKTIVSVDELSFEAALAELDETVRQLEAGDLPLDETLALFERGQLLSVRCQGLLQTAELKVQQLAPKAGGGYALEPFDEGGR